MTQEAPDDQEARPLQEKDIEARHIHRLKLAAMTPDEQARYWLKRTGFHAGSWVNRPWKDAGSDVPTDPQIQVGYITQG
jgi:hypothetical protein